MTTTDVTSRPICEDWITTGDEATAAELADVLGQYHADDLAPWTDELVRAVNELHRARICAGPAPSAPAGELRWDAGDPVIVLLRALASLARRAPTVSSPAAGLLLELLGPGPRRQPASAS